MFQALGARISRFAAIARTVGSRAFRRDRAYALVPLAFLAIDLFRTPLLYEHQDLVEVLRVDDLLARSSVDVGTAYGHRLHVLIGDIEDIRFLSHLGAKPSALVVSLYESLSRGEVRAGTSATALLDLLARHSPGDHDKLLDQIEKSRNYAPGTVLDYTLSKPIVFQGGPEIDRILAVRIENGKRETPYALQAGLLDVFRRAEGESIRSLVIPCLSVTWKMKDSVSFDEYFGVLFDTLKTTRKPQDLYIFFYQQWPTFMLETAVSSFNSRWSSQRWEKPGLASRIYEIDRRLALLATSICLLVASFHARLTWKSAMLIFFSFLGIAFTSYEGLKWLFSNEHGSLFLFLQVFVTLAEAALFPVVVKP